MPDRDRALPPLPAAESGQRLDRLPWRTYRLRVLGMGLALLPIAVVLRELEAGPTVWAWAALTCVAWPHIAFLWARRSGDPFRAELRNFVIDSAIAGSWVPMMHFNLLPSAVLLTVVTADKINSGIRGLWLRSLPALAIALSASALFNGLAFSPHTSMAVILACLPIMAIHTLTVSASTYRLVRRLQRQNLRLDELARHDTLTGLANRAHWQAQANRLLQRHQEEGQSATLLLLDLDHFKPINDRYGHAAGDEVLRAVADRIRWHLGERGHAGRLGGDEFAIALAMGPSAAEAFAENLRSAIEGLAFPAWPGLHCSASIGLAPPPDAGLGLREWMEVADRALYSAKAAGRNRAAGHGLRPGQRE